MVVPELAELLAVDSESVAAGSARPGSGPGSEPGFAVRSSGLEVAVAFEAFEGRAEGLEPERFVVGAVVLGLAVLPPPLAPGLGLELELEPPGHASMLFELVVGSASVAVSSGLVD